MWGGRFAQAPAEILAQINLSLPVDRRLAEQDLAGSRAHAAMLAAQGVLSEADAAAILEGLERVGAELRAGTFPFRDAYEDIHLNIEARLAELIGPAAGRLHTARSRNDQVATDFRLWTRQACAEAASALTALQAGLLERAAAHSDTLMPGFTHLQSAQPVTLGHHLLAYVEMAERDRGRFLDCARRLNECPLGAAALAGVSFPIDRHATAQALAFARPMANSLDAVSARDFAIEAAGAAAICLTHLSRLAEEIILWTSPAFGFARLSDALSTGSSIMPQKRNPDAAELVRAKTGAANGVLVRLLTLMKALPLAYAKDMQDDKAALFECFDALGLSLAAMRAMVLDLTFAPERMRAMAGAGYADATDLADWLVRRLDLPFRQAHHVAGAVVRAAESRGVDLAALPLQEMQAIEPRITAEVFAVLGPERSAASRTSYGGTAPVRVREQAAHWRAVLASRTSEESA
jgi:argininosuccinate lyase